VQAGWRLWVFLSGVPTFYVDMLRCLLAAIYFEPYIGVVGLFFVFFLALAFY